jgi:hypothetical protein
MKKSFFFFPEVIHNSCQNFLTNRICLMCHEKNNLHVFSMELGQQ